jgi:hypothetical protein
LRKITWDQAKNKLRKIEESIQKMRKQHLLKPNVLDTYKKVCQMLGFSPIKNEKVQKLLKKQGPKENGIDRDRKDPKPDQQNGEEKSN